MDQDFRELFFIVVFFALVFAGVQWLLLRYTHWSWALLVTGLVAFFIAFLYVTLKHATPNGGGNDLGVSEFITPTLLIFIVLFCGFCLIAYLTQRQVPKWALVLSVGSVVVFAVGRYVYGYIDNATFYFTLFSQCDIEVVNEAGGVPMLREISFQNTSNGASSQVDPLSGTPSHSVMVRFADRITFRSYSEKAGLFSEKFPFDYSVCQEKQGPRAGFLFWMRQNQTLPMKLVLQPTNSVSLYIGNTLVHVYKLKDEASAN